ncbi:MAG: AmmeMemoRadiSam system radical SAM enzyme [Elusimicrobia bacterium]|nr:AmmeMemoRadiSam system radical SAM enzyme [Elusimicrobiota bacterium]
MKEAPSLEDLLRGLTREGDLYDRQGDGMVRCCACGHECLIAEGKAGICRMRYNKGGRLLVPFGYVSGLRADPIEKKPFFHVLPGSQAMSFGMLGCNFSCRFCQNWLTSQVLRDPAAEAQISRIPPAAVARAAQAEGCPVVVSTYNEPLITSEWAAAIFTEARRLGLRCGYVSNGHANRRVLEYLRPVMSLYKVDLKCFDSAKYRDMTGGAMRHVLRSIEDIRALGFWLEVVTLVIPGWNDSDRELRGLAQFLAGVSPDIPWHVTAYHQDYRLEEPRDTAPESLARAAEIGKAEGLRFVYAGNLPGRLAGLENTACPACGELLIERRGFAVTANRLKDGCCPRCSAAIPGVWI